MKNNFDSKNTIKTIIAKLNNLSGVLISKKVINYYLMNDPKFLSCVLCYHNVFAKNPNENKLGARNRNCLGLEHL